jgi:hypothetical protein
VTILGPWHDWREDTVGHTEHPVNVAVDLLWSSDGEGLAIGGRQSHGHDLVSRKLRAQRFPGGVDTLFQEGALDADQQAESDFRDAVVELSGNRSKRSRAQALTSLEILDRGITESCE